MNSLSKSKSVDLSILFVDDDENILELVKQFFKDEFDIIAQQDASKIWEIIANNNIAVIVSDHHLRDTTGLDILSEVEKKHPAIKRFMITGDYDETLVLRAIKEGRVDGYFRKPFKFRDLKEELTNAANEYLTQKEKEIEIEENMEELNQLREIVYSSNQEIFESFTSIDLDDENHTQKIYSILNNLFEQSKRALDDWYNRIASINKLRSLLQEIQLLSEEYDLVEIGTVADYMIANVEMLKGNKPLAYRLFRKVLMKTEEYVEAEFVSYISPYLDNCTLTKYKKDQLEETELENSIYQDLDYILSDNIETITKIKEIDLAQPVLNSLSNLGYILILYRGTTVFKGSIFPRSKIEPSLIGNLLLALGDFTTEIFVEEGSLSSIQHDNGVLLIHAVTKELHYVAVAYYDSIHYRVWLKEFARQTRDLFLEMDENIILKGEDISQLNFALRDILYKDTIFNKNKDEIGDFSDITKE